MDGSRDGQLVVVSRDLGRAHFASAIAGTMRQLLDDWNFLSPQLEDLATTLESGKARHAFPFEPARCMAPLPRPLAWLRAEADALRPGAPGAWLGCGAAVGPGALRPLLALVTADVAAGSSADAAGEAVRLVMLGAEALPMSSPPGVHGPAWAAFGPVAVTPDELGPAWWGGRVRGLLRARRGAGSVWQSEAKEAFKGQLHDHVLRGAGAWLAAAAAERALGTGTVLGFALQTSPGAIQAQADNAEDPPMEPLLIAGETLGLQLDTAEADAPLGHLLLRAEPHGQAPAPAAEPV